MEFFLFVRKRRVHVCGDATQVLVVSTSEAAQAAVSQIKSCNTVAVDLEGDLERAGRICLLQVGGYLLCIDGLCRC
jgi:hypothetical protein